MPAMAMLHEKDPKEVVLEALGDISDFEVWKNQVLCAVYERPQKTRSGLLLADSTRDEDKFQGKVGLVVKLGPSAFVDDGSWSFQHAAAVGDWVFFRTSDSRAITVNGKLCRLIDDVDIAGRVQDPDQVW